MGRNHINAAIVTMFLWIEGLLKYQKVHNKNRPYQFIQCAIIFLRYSNLKIHHQIHTWVKSCQYNQCEKTLNEIHFYNLFNKLYVYLAGYSTIYKLKLNAPISFLSSIQKARELFKAATVRTWELQHVSTVHFPHVVSRCKFEGGSMDFSALLCHIYNAFKGNSSTIICKMLRVLCLWPPY